MKQGEFFWMSASKSKQLKAGTLLSYAQTIAGIVIALIYTPAMLRLLGKTEYGLYNIAASIISYVNLLNLGFSSSYVRFYSRDKAANDYKALARTNGPFLHSFYGYRGFGAVFRNCADRLRKADFFHRPQRERICDCKDNHGNPDGEHRLQPFDQHFFFDYNRS